MVNEIPSMIGVRSLLALLLLALPNHSVWAGEVTTSYEVTLNGQKFSVNAQATTNVTLDGKVFEMSVREQPEKTFGDGNISFAFPSSHAVSKKVKGDTTTWTLHGQDNDLMLLRMKETNPTEVGKGIVESLRQQYGAKSKQSDCKITLEGKTVSGIKITAELVGTTIVQEVYELRAGLDGYILMIQDSGKTESAETRTVKKLLQQTFQRTQASPPEQRR